MATSRRAPAAVLAVLLGAAALPVAAREGETHDPPATAFDGVGIEEHLGAFVPLDTVFTGEDGKPVVLGDIAKVPTILALVFYRCPNACDYLLTGMAAVLREQKGVPGKDFQVVMISIDERETPADALGAKRIGIASLMDDSWPADGWRFLTGSAASIDAVADAVGFRFVRSGDDFDHPLGLVILSPQGKIVRYMAGTDFLPLDLQMAVMEASTGTVRPTVARVLRVCFRYDPTSRRMVFNTLQVTATVVLVLAAVFVAYLVVSTRRRRASRRV